MITNTSCSECHRPRLARGYCSRHYTQFRKYGNPHARMLPERGEVAQWLETVALTSATTECIDWPFKSRYKKGYGSVFYNGKLTGAHRVSCILAHGAQPAGKRCVAHSCHRPVCVNPRHLRWVTYAENSRDQEINGTSCKGVRNPQAKLTEQDVLEIRATCKTIPSGVIAKKYAVSRRLIASIRNRSVWKHI